ncbi:hypothetical protein KY289_000627 [Solanum tuberosum]|nr:hypothetical protein KY289_000627 [Solanum tuberosum]
MEWKSVCSECNKWKTPLATESYKANWSTWSTLLDPRPLALIIQSRIVLLGQWRAPRRIFRCSNMGKQPSYDIARGYVYVGTGNLYSAPPEVLKCQEAQNNRTTPPTLGGYDVFTFACLVPNNPDCPPGPNMDADFGEAPMMLTILSNGRIRDVVVAVQKSGFAWKAGPGGAEGGGIWGAATDGRRVYTNIANGNKLPFTLAPSTQTTTAGGWVAIDANTGQILWTTANPSNETSPGPVTIANGVLLAGSVAPNGPLYTMDASNGKILWTFNTGATIYGGASISYGCVFIGHGYSVGLARLFHPTWATGTSLFAFCIM